MVPNVTVAAKKHDGRVDPDDGFHRHGVLRQNGQQPIEAPDREAQGGDAAEHGERHTLDQHLADELPPAGTQGGAHGKFAAAGDGARQEQVGDVGAGDQQHGGDGAQHQQERIPERARDRLAQVAHGDADIPVAVGVLLGDLAGDDRQLSADVIDGAARGGARDDPGVIAYDAALHQVRARLEPDGGPDVGGPEFEGGRHDADHRVGLAVEGDGVVQDAPVSGEALLPGGVAQHAHRRGGGGVFGVGEHAAEHRLHAEQGPDRRGHGALAEHSGFREARQRGGRAGGEGEVLDAACVPAPLEVIEVGHRHLAVGAIQPVRPDEEDVVAVLIGERMQQHGVDDAEDRRGGTDAQSQDRYHRGGEAGGLGELAQGEAQFREHGRKKE
jgi:hypothetical protein